MTQLETLIQTLCPNGVHWSSVNDLIKQKIVHTVSASIKLKRNDYLTEGATPIISQEEEFISGYTNVTDKNITEREYVCFGDHSEHIKFVDFAFVQGADGLKIMYCNQDALSSKYFYYAVSNFYKKHCNYERHFKYLQELQIPLPPLAVQSEIVRVLDKFTLHKAELAAELAARLQQYECYRDKLLTFDDTVKRVKIQDISTMICSPNFATLLRNMPGFVPAGVVGPGATVYGTLDDITIVRAPQLAAGENSATANSAFAVYRGEEPFDGAAFHAGGGCDFHVCARNHAYRARRGVRSEPVRERILGGPSERAYLHVRRSGSLGVDELSFRMYFAFDSVCGFLGCERLDAGHGLSAMRQDAHTLDPSARTCDENVDMEYFAQLRRGHGARTLLRSVCARFGLALVFLRAGGAGRRNSGILLLDV